MNTDQNSEFAETGDQISTGEDQLSQEIEKSEGTPSWGEEQQEDEFEEQPEADDESLGQTEVSSEIEEEPVEDEQEETQEETLPENPRRVLSFNDYFTNQN